MQRSALPVHSVVILAVLIVSAPTDAADSTHGQDVQQVGQWQRFQTTLRNTRDYEDPFSDVHLEVDLVGPDGRDVRFWGFYDGDETWKMRFMPDTLGVWRYKARFTDAASVTEGVFRCVSSDVPGMIDADRANPIWFGFSSGKHVLIRSLHVGDRFFADKDNSITGDAWNPALREAFLDWAQQQGYNMLSIASHYLNRNSKGRGQGWDTPDLWDAQTQHPNPAEFRRLERTLDILAARGMMVYPFAGFFGRDSDFPADPALQDRYISYTLARLGPYWNVLFMVGGPEPQLRAKSYLTKDQIDRIGRKIRSLDVFGHALSVHNPTGDDPFRDVDWPSYGILQGPKTTNRKKLAESLLRNHHPRRPLYAQETLWPGNVYHPSYADADIRRNAFVLLFCGATVNFADMNGDSSSGFSGTMDLRQKVQERHDIIKHVWDFFETIPFYRLSPRPDLVNAGCCLADTGHRYLVYLDTASTVSVDVESGPYRIRWVNAQDTADVRDADLTQDAQRLEAPGEGGDWILDLSK